MQVKSPFTKESADMITSLISTVFKATSEKTGEPTDIAEAIAYHEARVEYLKGLQANGFTTEAEYKKYQEAQEIITKHQEKVGQHVLL